MTVHEVADLHKRVERYEAAVEELRASHQEIKDILTDHILFDRWQQLGAELGFSASRDETPNDASSLNNHHQPEMSDAWG